VGGGGGLGGGGGGGGGGGALLIQLVFFCLSHPTIGVPVLILIVIAILYYQFFNPGNESEASNQPGPVGRPIGDSVNIIRQHDTAFDPDAFYNRVAGGFLKLQTAWCEQNLQSVRPFISDGIHERFSLQFAEQKAEGYRDHLDHLGFTAL
jgi:hypothetical protein